MTHFLGGKHIMTYPVCSWMVDITQIQIIQDLRFTLQQAVPAQIFFLIVALCAKKGEATQTKYTV